MMYIDIYDKDYFYCPPKFWNMSFKCLDQIWPKLCILGFGTNCEASRQNNLANFNSCHLPVLLATSAAGHLAKILKEVLAENHQTERLVGK